jgi:hypothetical protein
MRGSAAIGRSKSEENFRNGSDRNRSDKNKNRSDKNKNRSDAGSSKIFFSYVNSREII